MSLLEMKRDRSTARLGLILAVLFPLAQLGAAAHRAAVRHVVCPEHDALTHAGHADPGRAAPAPPAPDAPDAPQLDAPPAQPEHQHVACVLCATSRAGIILPSVAVHAPPPEQPQPRPQHLTEARARPRQALLLLAPRTSPPFVS